MSTSEPAGARPVSARRRGQPLFWTPARLFALAGLLEAGLSDEAIGRRLGRSAEAVRIARKRHGIRPRLRQFLSARGVARELGLSCAKVVTRWIEEGRLKGRRGQRWGQSRQWYVRQDDLFAFLDDPANWHLWRPERLADPWLRQVYAARREGAFLTQAEVAARCCVERGTVGRWLDRGLLPSVRIGRGNRLVPAGALVGFTPPGQRSKAGMRRQLWGADESARLLALRAAGQPWSAIAAELGRSVPSVSNRYRRVCREWGR